jgi:hypothetical protein
VIRLAVLAIALAAILPGPVAAAQPPGGVVPVARAASDTEVAVAGTSLLMGRTARRGVRLLSARVTGGTPRTLFSMAARPRRFLAMNDLDASAERVVFSLVELNPATEGIVRVSVWSGSPEGPFEPLVRRRGGAWIPVDVHASGSDAAFTEIRPVGDVARHVVVPAGGEGVTLNVPPDVQRVELAGSLVAFVERERRLVVQDWAAGGAERLRYTAGGAIKDFDLAGDGHTLLHVPSRRALELVDIAGSVHRVPSGGALPEDHVRLAGNQAVLRVSGRVDGDSHIALIDLATGQRRRLSPPSLDLGVEEAQLDAEGELVAWAANGCVFAAPLGGPGSSLVPPGPCPRAEINVEEKQPERLQGRTARVRLRCVTAPPPGCRGTIRLELDRPLGKARYLIPAGRPETVRVPLSSRGVAALERELRFPLPGGGAAVEVRTTLADGARPRSATPNKLIVLRPDRP